jgi:hypothetical protein
MSTDPKGSKNLTWLKPADPTDPALAKNAIAHECCSGVCLAMSDFEDLNPSGLEQS